MNELAISLMIFQHISEFLKPFDIKLLPLADGASKTRSHKQLLIRRELIEGISKHPVRICLDSVCQPVPLSL